MFIDIHHHLLCGVDDGAQSWDETTAMLRAAAADGISSIVATPHSYLGIRPLDIGKCESIVRRAQSFCKESALDVTVSLGTEVYIEHEPTVDLLIKKLQDNELPSLANSRFVLVEFPPDVPFARLSRVADKLLGRGYTPVLAHIERVDCLVRHLQNIASLRDRGARAQMNCSTLIKPRGFFMRRFVRRVLEERLIDYAATDAHNTNTRPVKMRLCHSALIDIVGREFADQLCGENQREIVSVQ